MIEYSPVNSNTISTAVIGAPRRPREDRPHTDQSVGAGGGGQLREEQVHEIAERRSEHGAHEQARGEDAA